MLKNSVNRCLGKCSECYDGNDCQNTLYLSVVSHLFEFEDVNVSDVVNTTQGVSVVWGKFIVPCGRDVGLIYTLLDNICRQVIKWHIQTGNKDISSFQSTHLSGSHEI